MHRAATGALVDTRWRMIRLLLIVGLALAWLGLPLLLEQGVDFRLEGLHPILATEDGVAALADPEGVRHLDEIVVFHDVIPPTMCDHRHT